VRLKYIEAFFSEIDRDACRGTFKEDKAKVFSMKRTAKGSQSICPVAPPIVVGEKETLFSLIPTPQPRRGSLGLMARLPIWLYRIGLCWPLGNRLLVLTHIGRKSGLARTFVLEVMRYTKETDTYFVAAGFGTKSIWLRNISQNSTVTVQVGHRRFDAAVQSRSTEEGCCESGDYAGPCGLDSCRSFCTSRWEERWCARKQPDRLLLSVYNPFKPLRIR
jgi:deazaflavin-dependent oxidoreductase (nitroreductase family)